MASDYDSAKDEIRRRVDIVQLVGQRVALKKAGRGFKGLCPFHDDRNPSFIVNPEFGSYRCWSCGAKGDVFDWVMETQKVEFPEALKILAKETGVNLPAFHKKDDTPAIDHDAPMAEALAFFREELLKSPLAREYTENRGLDQNTLDQWEIGYAPDLGEALATKLKRKNFALAEARALFLVDQDSTGGYFDRFRGRLMFPIRDERGRLVAFGGRVIGQAIPKYINSGDTPIYNKSRVLYGMHRAKEQIASSGHAVLAEGYLDVIACHRAGVNNAVASLGTALAEDHAKLLKRWCQNVTILYDADPAGIKAADRAAEILQAEGLRVAIALMPPGQDPDTLLAQQGPEAVKRAAESGTTPMQFRLGQLKTKFTPDSPEYWEQVTQVLSHFENPLELQTYLIPIASTYPGIRNPEIARQSLEKMVLAARKKRIATRKTPYREEPPPPEPLAPQKTTPLPTDPLLGAEKTLLLALFEPTLAHKALQTLAQNELLQTHTARLLAQDLLQAVQQSSEKPTEWLHALADPRAQDILRDLALADREPVSPDALQEAIGRLAHQKAERESRQLRLTLNNDTDLKNLNDRLRQLKGQIPE